MHAVIVFLRKIPLLYGIVYGSLRFFFRIKERFINYEYDKKLNPSVSLDKIRSYNQNRTYGPDKHICKAPYTNMHFRLNGDVNACCYNMNHSFGNITRQSLKEIWNSQNANELRGYIDNYNLEHGCKFCKYQLDAENHTGFYASVFDKLPFTKKADNGYPAEMTFEITNLCNLECLMCNGDYSNLIRKNRENKPALPLLYKDNFLEELKDFLPHLSKATFLGGEPLLVKSYYKIWKYIIGNKINCRLHLQTNATVLPEEFKELLNSGLFSIGVSIDAWDKDLFESIRKHADWETVHRNFIYYVDLYKKGRIDLTINFCPIINNWQEAIKIFDAANQYDIPVSILTVITPPYLSLKNISGERLEQIIAKLITHDLPAHTAIQVRNKSAFAGFISQLNSWRSAKQERLDNSTYFNMPLAFLQHHFSDMIQTHPDLQHLSSAEKQEIIASIELILVPYDEDVQHRSYQTLIESVDYFFDDSLEKLDKPTIRDGLARFVTWELDGIRYHKETAIGTV